MLLLENPEWVERIFSEFSYTGPFLVLLLCGLGLPLPEEVTLLGSGVLAYRGEVEFWPIVGVCSLAILIGDSAPYWLGRRFGMHALRIPIVARVVHPERFARLERRFQEHGNWATFACRFLAGFRLPGYFLAGTMRMPYLRFVLLDAAGVALSVPVSVYLGMLFAGQIDRLQESMRDLHLLLAFLLLAVVCVFVVRGQFRIRKLRNLRARRAERTRRTDLPGSEEARGTDGEGRLG